MPGSGSALTSRAIDGSRSLHARSDGGWPLVTVAILSYNRREALRATIAKLSEDLDYPSDALEILVADNASEDGSAAMVAEEYPTAQVLQMPENLGAPALNRAFAQARGEWVLILDDDCWIDGAALKRAVAAAESNRADLVSFRIRSGLQPDYYFSDDYNIGLFGFWGCAWLVSRRALGQLGGYDPNIFIWGNEVEFTLRLLDAGYRHLHLPEVVAMHMKAPAAPTPTPVFRLHKVNIRHWSYSAAKHLQVADAARVISRLLLTIAIDMLAISPRAGATFGQALAGVVDGLRVRSPVRAEVSAIYRDGFISFANPVRFLRTPRQRLRARRGSSSRIPTDAQSRFEAFREARRPFYPVTYPAVLEV